MLNVGLTGGIASGKSTVAGMLVDKGAVHIDFDALAHFVEEPGKPAWQAIVETFGDAILNEDRTINRGRLGAIVFEDHEKLKQLNAIVHPAVRREWHRRLETVRDQRPDAIVLSDVPLLIEGGMQSLVDLVVLVYITPEEQVRRLMERNGLNRAEAQSRLASQMPIGEKLPYADLVINNEGSMEETRSIVEGIWQELTQREKGKAAAGL